MWVQILDYILSKALSWSAQGGRVIAIEAAPSHVRTLSKNIELNGMSNVSLIAAAVGDATGQAKLTLPSGVNLGMFTLGPANGHEVYDVTVRRIDDLLEESGIHSVDLIKMDIEGSEYHALRGAAKTLTKHRPVVIIELNEGALRQCGSSSDDVIQLLGTFGYRGWLIGRSASWKTNRYDRINWLR